MHLHSQHILATKREKTVVHLLSIQYMIYIAVYIAVFYIIMHFYTFYTLHPTVQNAVFKSITFRSMASDFCTLKFLAEKEKQWKEINTVTVSEVRGGK